MFTKLLKLISGVGLLVLFVGCGQDAKKSEDSVLSIHALCNVMNNTVVVVCVDYAKDRIENQSSCTIDERANYATRGANGSMYVGVGSSSATTGCHMQNRGLILLGSCLLNEMNVRYYTSMWNITAAQADCVHRQGNWQNPE